MGCAAPAVAIKVVGLTAAGPAAGGFFASWQGAAVAKGSMMAAGQSFAMGGMPLAATCLPIGLAYGAAWVVSPEATKRAHKRAGSGFAKGFNGEGFANVDGFVESAAYLTAATPRKAKESLVWLYKKGFGESKL